LSNRQLHWEPRGAWQIVAETVADQACFAHQQPAAPVRGAAGVTGETSHDRNFSIKRRPLDEVRSVLLERIEAFFKDNPAWE
jgi:hypothetical protein